MDTFLPLVIGITVVLGFVALGLVVFVMGTPAGREEPQGMGAGAREHPTLSLAG